MTDNIFDKSGFSVQGHIHIFDPSTGETIINKRNAIHYENMSIALAESLSNAGQGFVYEMAFEGNDAEAEMIEKETGFSLLGESTRPFSKKRKCTITGKTTHRRVFLAKTY